MNDFTKEELECLLLTLDKVLIASRKIQQDALQNKLQSMIDNYCEHERTRFVMDVGIDKCVTCGRIANED